MDNHAGRTRFQLLLALILFINAALTLPWLGTQTLWNTDEGRISGVAREMSDSGDWIVPRVDGEPYFSYPPLEYWLAAASGRILGFHEWSMRLPTALAGLMLIAVVAFMGRRLAGETAGLAAAMFLATLTGYLNQESVVRADVLLALFSVIAFDRFLIVAEGNHRPRHLVEFYLSLALGILAKGPLGLVLPGLGVIAWLAIHRRPEVLLRLKPAWGLPALLAIVLPWYVVMSERFGARFIRENLFFENAHAFLAGADHPRALWFYFPSLIARTLPWIFFLALAWPVRHARGFKISLAWTSAVFLFLTVSAAKRPSYLTYLYPGLALSTGVAMAALWKELPRRLVMTLLIVSGLLAVSSVMLVEVRLPTTDKAQTLLGILPYLALAGALGAAVLAVVTLRRGALAGTVALAGLTAGLCLIDRAVLEPRLDEDGRHGVDFCRTVLKSTPTREQIGTVDPQALDGFLLFYLDRPIVRKSGEAGYYIGTADQCDNLGRAGHPVKRLASVVDYSHRQIVFFRIVP